VAAERGYTDTRIADVAALAGTSPALVIYYSTTKDYLLTEAVRLAGDQWYDLGSARLAAIGSAAGRLEWLVAAMCLSQGDDGVPSCGPCGSTCGPLTWTAPAGGGGEATSWPVAGGAVRSGGRGQELGNQLDAGVRVQQSQAPDGLALPRGVHDESGLLLEEVVGPGLIVGLAPVSYTHLDVYKRQG